MKAEGTGKQLQPKTDFADQRTEILRTCLRQNVNGTGYSPAFEFTTALTKAPGVVNMARLPSTTIIPPPKLLFLIKVALKSLKKDLYIPPQ